ncbi:MAG: MarR family transcriptional regulator [Spirochaetales bacterium]|nr:MarR family transcriptional regulator [Spirochaetales bacterium]
MSEKEINLKLVIVLGRMIKAMDKRLVPGITGHGITMSQFAVMEALLHKGALTVNEIIETTLSSSGNMGVVIANLEKRGLVEKQISHADRRSRKVSLTTKGHDLISTVYPEHETNIMNNFGGLELSEKQQLIELIKKFGKSMEDHT